MPVRMNGTSSSHFESPTSTSSCSIPLQTSPTGWAPAKCSWASVTETSLNNPTGLGGCCWALVDPQPTKIPVQHSLRPSLSCSCPPGRQIDFLAVHCTQHFSEKVINWRSTGMQNSLSQAAGPQCRWEAVPGCPHIRGTAPFLALGTPGTVWDVLSAAQFRSLKHWNPLAVTPCSGLRKLATWVNVRGSCTYYIPIIFWQTFPSIMRYRKRGPAL